MHTLTLDEVTRQPGHLLDDLGHGKPALVTRDDKPLFMAVPLGKGLNSTDVRLELAIQLFDSEQVSLGTAARIAGLSISEMIDALGSRKIPVARYEPGELEQELDYVRSLADRG